MKREILVWGYLSSFILLLGAIFLNHNFYAGKVLYLCGFFAFNLGYLIPLFYVIFKENQENKIGLVLLFSIAGFITFLTGVSFFVVNLGGGIILIYVGAGILILAIFTMIILSRRFYETTINSWFPVLVFGVFIVGSLLIGMVHRHVMRAFTIHNIESVKMSESINARNIILSQKILEVASSKLPTDSLLIGNIKKLDEHTSALINYIENLKIDLIKNVEGDAYKMLEGKTLANLVPVQSNVEINTVTRIMLRRNKGKAFELKTQLINYRKTVFELSPMCDSLTEQFINESLNTEIFELGKNKVNQSWEYQHFYDLPLITVLSELSCIQMKISLVEGYLLNDYYMDFLKLTAE